MSGKLQVIGLGPGEIALLTPAARDALESADAIFGYKTYLNLIEEIAPHTPRFGSGMRKEVQRAQEALECAAKGKCVAVVSSGDAGVYGMAGLIYDVCTENNYDVEIDVVPGISALNAAAALLGAPLMMDFAAISLSDQLIPREQILRRVELAAQGDFVICLYNPKGRTRTKPFELACDIFEQHLAPETPVGVVRAAYRPRQQRVEIIKLSALRTAEIDMLTVIIIGNRSTRILNGKMVTPRGYEQKYDLGGRS